MDLQWWINSVIVPLVCATIGGVFGYLGCKVRITNKAEARDVSGVNVQNSDNASVNK